jgi:drug/metabolite transporter (DMT)-like permease
VKRIQVTLPTALLLAITAIWGWTFLIVKDAVAHYPVSAFLALRFILAATLLAPFAFKGGWRSGLRIGLILGIPLAAGYLFQTFGLKTTSAANAGLLTGLYVILTPIFDRILYSAPVARVTITCAIIGLLGTGLLTLAGTQGLTIGDALEVLTAAAFAAHIVWLGRYSPGTSAMQLAFGQMSMGAIVFSFLAGTTLHGSFPVPPASVLFAVIVTGALASALAFWVQTWVQQRMPPARTAIVMLGEPAFAAAFAVWLGGEKLAPIQWVGAILIFGSLVLHELWTVSHNRRISGT